MNELSYLSVWDKLNSSEQNILTAASSRRKFKKGEILHNGSTRCTGLMLVLSG